MTKFAINIAWEELGTRNADYYFIRIDQASKLGVKMIRIILCSWNLNPIFNKSDLERLMNIIKHANNKRIDIVLTLFNFPDFNKFNYLDTGNKKYSWYSNVLRKKYKRPKSFFKNVDCEIIDKIIKLLEKISIFDNVKIIEIMNEIDQVQINNSILINWCNNLFKILSKKFSKYQFSVSISNYCYYDFFKNKLLCYVDLHSYSFPMDSSCKNLLYLAKKQKEILYIGEYSKNSDRGYINEYNSMIYFTSSLWISKALGLAYTPMSWWWDDVLTNEKYKKIINIFNKLEKQYSFTEIEQCLINESEYYINEMTKDKIERKKIKERLVNLLKHPLFIKYELNNIKKFIIKKKNTNEEILIFKLSNNNDNFYMEVNKNVLIDLKLIFKDNFEIIDLITGKKHVLKDGKSKLYGCYLLKKL